jgi:hypothetical protein
MPAQSYACRDDAATAHLALKAAGPLKLQLSQLLAKQSQAQMQDGEFAAAQQQHAKALALAKDAAEDSRATGAALLRLQALQLAANLLLQDPSRLLLQEQHKQQQQQQQRGQQAVALPLDESPLLLEARQMLQVGHLLALTC